MVGSRGSRLEDGGVLRVLERAPAARGAQPAEADVLGDPEEPRRPLFRARAPVEAPARVQICRLECVLRLLWRAEDAQAVPVDPARMLLEKLLGGLGLLSGKLGSARFRRNCHARTFSRICAELQVDAPPAHVFVACGVCGRSAQSQLRKAIDMKIGLHVFFASLVAAALLVPAAAAKPGNGHGNGKARPARVGRRWQRRCESPRQACLRRQGPGEEGGEGCPEGGAASRPRYC